MSERGRFFLLYHGGRDDPGPQQRAHIRSTPGLRVLEEASQRLLLVECSEEELRRTLRELVGWSCSRERKVRARQE